MTSHTAPDRRGFALVAVLLLLLAIAGVTTVMLAAASREALVTRNAVRIVAARLAAESAARLALERWDATTHDDAPIDARVAVPTATGATGADTWYAAEAERLDAHRFLIRARGWVSAGRDDPPVAEARMGALVLSIDIDALVSRFGVGLETPGAVELGATGTIAPARTAEGTAACPDSVPALRVDPRALTLSAAGVLDGAVQGIAADSLRNAFPRGLAFLDTAWLAELAERRAPLRVHPQPAVTAGDCDPDADQNWGDPNGGSCAAFLPLVYGASGVVISGGTGQGILIAGGDVVLEDGAQFHGVVLTTGRLVVRDGEVRGAAVALGGATLDGRLTPDACTVNRAFEGAEPLRRAFPLPGRRFIPLF